MIACLLPRLSGNYHASKTGPVPALIAKSVTCLATDACLTADPGVASLIPARYYTFVEMDHEIISTLILLPSADSFKKGCCKFHSHNWLTACSSLPKKSVVR